MAKKKKRDSITDSNFYELRLNRITLEVLVTQVITFLQKPDCFCEALLGLLDHSEILDGFDMVWVTLSAALFDHLGDLLHELG